MSPSFETDDQKSRTTRNYRGMKPKPSRWGRDTHGLIPWVGCVQIKKTTPQLPTLSQLTFILPQICWTIHSLFFYHPQHLHHQYKELYHCCAQCCSPHLNFLHKLIETNAHPKLTRHIDTSRANPRPPVLDRTTTLPIENGRIVNNSTSESMCD